MQKKRLVFVVTAILALLMAQQTFAAGGKDSGGTQGQKKFKIAFANLNDVFPYLVKVRTYVQKYGQEAGMEVVYSHADSNLNLQMDQIENYLTQGIDVLIAVPVNPIGITPIIEKCWAQGVPVLTVCSEAAARNTHVGSRDVDAGKMQAEYLAKVLPKGGKVLYQTQNPDEQMYLDRRAGFMTLFEMRPDLVLLAEQNTINRTDLGMAVAETWIQQFPQFDCIAAMNDDSALGAIEALKAANRLKGVYVVGIDGSDPALQSIKAGEMACSAFQDASAQAKALVDMCIRFRDGEDPANFKDVTIPFVAVDKSNVSQFYDK
jgi:inositol transport system substrate-binding protein